MFSGVGLAAAFDWDAERINYESVRKNFDELELMKRLRIDTIFCDSCGQRLIVDCKIEGIEYCSCAQNTSASKVAKADFLVSQNKIQPQAYEKPWIPYLERKNMVIWRREESPGLFAYKGAFY